jgi:[acyl-carrier-protein] S-malonyltransferase
LSAPLVLLFGGQSSRDAFMFDRLEAVDPRLGAAARARAERHAQGDPTDFSSNRTIQVAVLAAVLGWRELLAERGLTSTASAGLSLGEYAHLVDIGALDAEDALALVARRGELYDAGPAGCMAAILPTPWEELAPLVERVAAAHGGPEALAPAVFNSPTQTVVGGDAAAVEALIAAADEELYARGILIEARIPMHTPRFAPVAPAFRSVLERTRWASAPRAHYWPNVTATATAATPATVVDHLTRHVLEPVLWRDTVDRLIARYPDAVFVEPGPGTVIRDLMARRWHPEVGTLALDDPEAPAAERPDRVAATLSEIARRVGRPTAAAAGPQAAAAEAAR